MQIKSLAWLLVTSATLISVTTSTPVNLEKRYNLDFSHLSLIKMLGVTGKSSGMSYTKSDTAFIPISLKSTKRKKNKNVNKGNRLTKNSKLLQIDPLYMISRIWL